MNRRHLIELFGAGAMVTALPGTAGAASPPRAAVPRTERTARRARAALADPLYLSSASALAAAIRDGEVGSLEVVDACLARIEEVNPTINAVFALRPEEARAEARQADTARARGEIRGPLHGVPMTIKDSLDTAGVVSTAGTLGRKDFVPGHDATVVARAKAAGAILLGKTNTPEFTAYFETFNLVYGQTNNPWNPSRTPGGSSGGAAAIVAAGGAPFDIGSDFGGSIRLPAHYCGVAGLKPTFFRVPSTGHILEHGGLQYTFQQLGPIARTVQDLDLLLRVIAGPDYRDPNVLPMALPELDTIDVSGLRVAFYVDNGVATPTPETRDIVRAAAAAVQEAGARVVEARPDGLQECFDVGQELWGAGSGAGTLRELERWGTTEHTFGEIDPEGGLTADELDLLIERWFAVRKRMTVFFQDHDVIVCPANAAPAAEHRTVLGTETEPLFSYTENYNITGWPAVVVPGGMSPEGLPIGVQVVAAPSHEARALAVAREIESRLGGYRPPPL